VRIKKVREVFKRNISIFYLTMNTYTWCHDTGSDLNHVKWIVVTTTASSIRVDESRIFPCLREATVVEIYITFFKLKMAKEER